MESRQIGKNIEIRNHAKTERSALHEMEGRWRADGKGRVREEDI